MVVGMVPVAVDMGAMAAEETTMLKMVTPWTTRAMPCEMAGTHTPH